MKRIPAGENPMPKSGASLLRFSSESTESNESGRSPGLSDFCRPSHPLFSAGAEWTMACLTKAFSNTDKSGMDRLTVAGTAPVLHRIPY